jgi:1-acyl-sn-glycerol-3-phosphate acyltransferase
MIFFRKIIFTKKDIPHQKGPLLLACNHPNSFLDALLLGAYFDQPIHFLARGDAFKNPLAKKILLALKAIPIYRLSEGKEYLSLNDATFERCTKILLDGGIVLIFSEGLCLNQWHLRPLKKGTARIALNAWKHQTVKDTFPVLPVTFNYSSFNDFRKTVIIDFGEPMFYENIPQEKNEAEQVVLFNKILHARLERGILFEKNHTEIIPFLLTNSNVIKNKDHEAIRVLKRKQTLLLNLRHESFFYKLKKTKQFTAYSSILILNLVLIVLLSVPALAALIIHLPFYLPLKYFIKKKTQGTVFYHSALFSSLIIFYPLYVLLLTIIFTIVFKSLLFLEGIIIMPLLALTCLKWMDCFECVMNYLRFPKKETVRLQQILQS